MVLRSAGWESNFQRGVETDSTVGIENCIIGEGFSIRVQQSFGNCPKYISGTQRATTALFQADA